MCVTASSCYYAIVTVIGVGVWSVMGVANSAAGCSAFPADTNSVFRRASTDSVPVAERFDYWRSLFRASRIERPRSSISRGFDGEIVTSDPARDVVFSGLHGEPIACQFGRGDSDMVLLGCVRAGTVGIRRGSEQVMAVGPQSGVVLFDCDRPFNTLSGRYAMDYLVLPRTLITEVMADDPVAANRVVRVLPPGLLTLSLQQHMWTMAVHGVHMAPADANNTMAVARALAVSILAGVNTNWRSLPESYDDDLLAAARHQLRLHTGDPDFTADRLSAALGCSRAHLYRLFERRGQTITGQLREFRLQRAYTLLKTRPEQAVGMIAMYCGYTDLTAFGKAFRRRFGLAPSDCRSPARHLQVVR